MECSAIRHKVRAQNETPVLRVSHFEFENETGVRILIIFQDGIERC